MRARRLPAALVFFAVAIAAASRPVRSEQTPGRAVDAPGVESLLARVEQRVLEYFGRAQSIVGEETTRILEYDQNFSSGSAGYRTIVSEVRVDWDSATDGTLPEATFHRTIVSINGRPPKEKDTHDCFDPKPITPEPLAIFVRPERNEYQFSAAGTKKIDNRPTISLDYKPTAPPGKPTASWRENCASFDLPHWVRGRVFVDAASAQILRLDEFLARRLDFDVPFKRQIEGGWGALISIDSWNSSTRYKPVTFHEPDETVLLPDTIETSQSFRARIRIVQSFKNYRRFMTGGRLVKNPR